MTIQRARKFLGKRVEKLTDVEIKNLLNQLTVLSDMAIDQALAMSPKEKKHTPDSYINEG